MNFYSKYSEIFHSVFISISEYPNVTVSFLLECWRLLISLDICKHTHISLWAHANHSAFYRKETHRFCEIVSFIISTTANNNKSITLIIITIIVMKMCISHSEWYRMSLSIPPILYRDQFKPQQRRWKKESKWERAKETMYASMQTYSPKMLW